MHTSDIVIMRAAVPFEKSTDRNSSRSPTAAAVSGPLPYKVPLRKSSGEPFFYETKSDILSNLGWFGCAVGLANNDLELF